MHFLCIDTMVKRPPVIPTVRVIHLCPPIVVRTKLSDFRAVVQELTGVENSTVSISMKGSISRHGQFHKCVQVSEDGSWSAPFINADAEFRASTHDHYQSDHITTSAASWIEAGNNNNGALDTGIEKVSPYEDCVEGFLNEEVCIDEALSAISSSDLSSPIWTAPASSHGNYCMQSKMREGDMEHVPVAGTSGVHELLELVTYPKASNLISTRYSGATLTSPAPLIDSQHLVGDPLLNSKECLSPNEGNTGFTPPYIDYGSLHADFYYCHHLLQRFDDNEDKAMVTWASDLHGM